MFSAVLRASRPATRTVLASSRATAPRGLSTSIKRASDHGPPPPQLFGPGAKAGTVPTDLEQATGMERLEILGELEGIEVFDMSPLQSDRVGTLADPIRVPSYADDRIIGCTGSPADSHDVNWYNLNKKKQVRCQECGSVYVLDFLGNEHAAHH